MGVVIPPLWPYSTLVEWTRTAISTQCSSKLTNQMSLEVQVKRKGNYIHKHNTCTLLVGKVSTEQLGNTL